jgi:hypothetical protein
MPLHPPNSYIPVFQSCGVFSVALRLGISEPEADNSEHCEEAGSALEGVLIRSSRSEVSGSSLAELPGISRVQVSANSDTPLFVLVVPLRDWAV